MNEIKVSWESEVSEKANKKSIFFYLKLYFYENYYKVYCIFYPQSKF